MDDGTGKREDEYMCLTLNMDLLRVVGLIVLPPATLLVWLFGVRWFVARNGRTRVTAASWGLSMWADWTTALEITRETGIRCWSGWVFIALQGLLIVLLGSMFIGII